MRLHSIPEFKVMKTKSAAYFRLLASLAPLLAGASLCAAPLTWFPGPTLDSPISSAATTVASGFGNVLIGGDSYYDGYGYPISYLQNLIATNAYWGSLGALYSINIAPGAVANPDLILLYGGTDGTNSTSAVLAYSLTGDNVPTPLPMSVPRSYLGYAPDGSGNAYAIGGLDDTGQPLATVERCNLNTGIWTNITELPAARYNFPAGFDRTNRIYIFGGRTNTSAGAEIASVLRYSTQSRTWTAVASLPVPTAGSAATLGVDGKIYVVGGASGGVTTNVVQVYNPSANTWTLSTPLPEGLNAASIGVDSLAGC